MRRFTYFVVSVAMMVAAAHSLAQEAVKKVKISSFAPLKETEAQLEFFMDKIGKDLSSQESYTEAEQQRVALDASTVAVLGFILGQHDEKTPLKQSASKLIELAGELADSSGDFEEATEKLAALRDVIKSQPKGEEVGWDEPVADLAMLMQQVPIVNAPLRRGVDDKRRFARNAPKVAGRAVTLAAIAQASLIDTSYCGDEEDEKAWQSICADMRDACAEVYQALIAKDQDRAKAANARVVETCDACHHRFRD